MPPGSPFGHWDGAASSPGDQVERPDELIVPLVTAREPGLLALCGVGPETAALLLAAAGDHPERLRSEAAWAHLCAVAPIPASSGKRTRHRLNRGGDGRLTTPCGDCDHPMSSHPATRASPQPRIGQCSAQSRSFLLWPCGGST
jgi:hypothetical protein